MTLRYQLAYTMMGFYGFAIVVALSFVAVWILCKVIQVKTSYKAADNVAESANKMTAVSVITQGAKILYIFGAFLIGLGIVMGYARKYDFCLKENMIAYVVLGIALVAMLACKSEFSKKTVSQMMAVSVWLLFFYVSAVFGNMTIKEYKSMMYMGLAVTILNAVYWIISYKKCERKTLCLSEYKFLMVIGLVVFGVSLLWIDVPLLWDSAFYLKDSLNAARWEFTTGNVFLLDLAFHHSAGYTLMIIPGIWIFDDSVLGIHVMHLIMMLFTAFCFWELVRKIAPKTGKIERSLIVLLLLFTPCVMGLSSSCNVDYGMLCFAVWLLYAWTYDLKVFEALWGIMLCLTKEPGVVLYAGILFGIYVIRFINASGVKIRLFKCISLGEWITAALPAFLWLAIFVIAVKCVDQPELAWTSNGSSFYWAGYFPDENFKLNCFGLAPVYILSQLSHLFIINFEWIITLLILVLAAYIVKKVKVSKSSAGSELIYILVPIMGIMFFTILYMLFITHPHLRYVAPAHSLILLLLVLLITEAFEKDNTRIVIYVCLTVLMCIQTFASVDPVTNALGHKINIGKGSVTSYTYESSGPYRVTDYTLYNYQGNQYGYLISKALEDIDIDTSLLLVPLEVGDMAYCAFGGDTKADEFSAYYDAENRRFSTIKMDGFKECNYGIINENTGEIEYHLSRDNVEETVNDVYYLELPYSTVPDIRKSLTDFGWKIEEEKEVTQRGGWSMKIIKLGH